MKISDVMATTKQRQGLLKLEIESGHQPIIHNVSATSRPVYTMGDLEALGWMTKSYTTDQSGDVTGWTRAYHGPKPVRVKTMGAKHLQVLNPGEVLE